MERPSATATPMTMTSFPRQFSSSNTALKVAPRADPDADGPKMAADSSVTPAPSGPTSLVTLLSRVRSTFTSSSAAVTPALPAKTSAGDRDRRPESHNAVVRRLPGLMLRRQAVSNSSPAATSSHAADKAAKRTQPRPTATALTGKKYHKPSSTPSILSREFDLEFLLKDYRQGTPATTTTSNRVEQGLKADTKAHITRKNLPTKTRAFSTLDELEPHTSVRPRNATVANSADLQEHFGMDGSVPPSGSKPVTGRWVGDFMRRFRQTSAAGTDLDDIGKDFWMRDETSKECYQCKLPFTTFRRRHHCRICGQVFCNKCASEVLPGERFGFHKDIRVCDYCCARVLGDNDDDMTYDYTLSNQNTASSALIQQWNKAYNSGNQSPAPTLNTINDVPPSIPGSIDISVPTSSLDNLRRIISHGSTLLSSKLFGGSTSGIAVDPSNGASFDDSFSENEVRHPLPFRNHAIVNDDASATDDEIGESALLDSGQHGDYDASRNDEFVQFFAQQSIGGNGSTPKMNPAATPVQHRLHSDEEDDGMSTVASSQLLRSRRNAVSNFKYSANALRGQLTTLPATSPVHTAVALPASSPIDDDRELIGLASSPVSPGRLPQRQSNFIELSSAAVSHVYRTFAQILQEFGLEPSVWTEAILPLLANVCTNVDPDVSSDSIDPRHYVHIKRISSGFPDSCNFFSGVIVNKNVMHKRMLRVVHKPRLLFISFPLEYTRVERQFTSLDPVLSQEREYLSHLINRLCALRPDVIFCERNVSRVALELLLEREVVVVSHVRTKVLDRMVRRTDGDLISSIDQITLRNDTQLGSCRSFYLKTYEYASIDGRIARKTLMFLDGCDPSVGCTILLRGADLETLTLVKKCVQFMCYMVIHLRREESVFQNQHSLLATEQSDIGGIESVKKMRPFEVFLEPFKQMIMTISPLVVIPPPYLLRRLCDEESALSNMTLTMPDGKEKTAAVKQLRNMHETMQAFTDHLMSGKLVDFSPSKNASSAVKAAYNFLTENQELNVSPLAHQNLTVLYCNVCTLTSLPCHPPEIHMVEYYKETDMTLGQYLEELCFDSSYMCPSILCQRPMLLHFRSYVHGQSRVNVIIEEFPSPTDDVNGDTIYMWSLCKICGEISPLTPMDASTWKFSFGKYLELSFYHTKLFCSQPRCSHSITRDHIRYFGLKNLAVRFEFGVAELFDVSAPPLEISLADSTLVQLKDDNLDHLRQSVLRYYQSVLERLADFQSSTGMDVGATRFREWKADLVELSKRAPLEKVRLLQLLQDSYLDSLPTDYCTLNRAARKLYENCLEWDREFARLIRKFLLSEKMEKRYTNSSRRHLFQDRDSTANADVQVTGNQFQPSNNVKGPSEPNAPTQYSLSQQISLGTEMPIMLNATLGLERWARQSDGDFNDSFTSGTLPKLGDDANGLVSGSVNGPPAILALEKDIETTEFEALDRHFVRKRTVCDAHADQPIRSRTSSCDVDIVQNDNETNLLTRILFQVEDVDISSTTQCSRCGALVNILVTDLSAANEESISNANYDNNIESGGEDLRRRDTISTASIYSSGGVMPRRSQDILVAQQAAAEGERLSLMKTFKDFWAQSGSGTPSVATPTLLGGEFTFLNELIDLKPLMYPFTTGEHFLDDSDLVVREDEPASIIAFALSSRQYQDEEKRVRMSTAGAISNSNASGSIYDGGVTLDKSAETAPSKKKPASSVAMEMDDLATRRSVFGDSGTTNHRAPASLSRLFMPTNPGDDPIEDILLRASGTHIKYEFTAGAAKCFCRVYFAEQFDALRRNCGCDATFVQSLSRCSRWHARAGQSGSYFFKTRDDRYMMKQMSKAEMDAFVRFAPSYFEYMTQALFHELPTALAKIFGVYRIGFKNTVTGRSLKIDVLVMENLFYDRRITRIFDLKGSMRNRHVQSTGKQSEVLLDENLMETIGESPLFIRQHCKKLLRASVWNDTLFLSKLNVMDYSLLVGIDEEKQELVVGIVDFIRTFTWDKKLESWVKETGFLGGGGREPTIISPKQYKNRFRDSMEKYFLLVPDKFCTAESVSSAV